MSSFIRLTGVVETTDCYSADVPRNTAKEIAVTHLAAVTIKVSLVTPTGTKVLVGVTSPVLTVSATNGNASPILKKSGTVSGNVLTFELTAADTKRFCAGRYMYDVWVDVSGKDYQVVATSPLRMLASVNPQP